MQMTTFLSVDEQSKVDQSLSKLELAELMKQEQAESEQEQAELMKQEQAESEQEQAELEQAKAELEQAKAELEQIQSKMIQAQANLNQVTKKLCEKKVKLLKSQDNTSELAELIMDQVEICIQKINKIDENLAKQRAELVEIELVEYEELKKISKHYQFFGSYDLQEKFDELDTLSKPSTYFLVITEFDTIYDHDNSNETMIVEIVRASSCEEACEQYTAYKDFVQEYGENIGCPTAHCIKYVSQNKQRFEHRIIKSDIYC